MSVAGGLNAGFAIFVALVGTGGSVRATSAEPAGGATTQPAATQPAAKRIIVEGQLYDYVGAGIAQARVTVTHKKTGRILGTAVTNRLGDFSVETDDRSGGSVLVTFEKPNCKTHTVEVELDPAGEALWLDWEMQGDLVLAGLVVDYLDNKPVAGATVEVEAAYRQWSASSGPEGEFRIEGLPPGRFRVMVKADNYARKVMAAEVGADDHGVVSTPQPVTQPASQPAAQSTTQPTTQPATQPADSEAAQAWTIRLKPERIVHLAVVDEADQAIRGVNVECYDEKNNDYRHLVTGDNGKATARGLSCDAVVLSVRLSHEAFVSDTDFDRVLEFPADKTETDHRLVMARAGLIVGKVLLAESGQPLLGARVSVGQVLSDALPRAWSALDGGYRVTGVTPGPVVVTVDLSGHAPQLKELTVRAGVG